MTEVYSKDEYATLQSGDGRNSQYIVRTTSFNKDAPDVTTITWSEEIEVEVLDPQALVNKSASELFPELVVRDVSLNSSYCECCGEDISITITGRKKATPKQIAAAKKKLDKK